MSNLSSSKTIDLAIWQQERNKKTILQLVKDIESRGLSNSEYWHRMVLLESHQRMSRELLVQTLEEDGLIMSNIRFSIIDTYDQIQSMERIRTETSRLIEPAVDLKSMS